MPYIYVYMAYSYGPSIVKSGLVLALDAANRKSYPGSGTVWSDLSGNNITGSLVNGPTYSSANGGSIVFDGTNDYVNCGDLPIFRISSQITLEAFFNISTYVNWSGIIGKSDAAKGVYVMHLAHTAQRVRFSYNSVSPWTTTIVDGNYPLTTNHTYFSFELTFSPNVLSAATVLFVGKYNGAGNDYWLGWNGSQSLLKFSTNSSELS